MNFVEHIFYRNYCRCRWQFNSNCYCSSSVLASEMATHSCSVMGYCYFGRISSYLVLYNTI